MSLGLGQLDEQRTSPVLGVEAHPELVGARDQPHLVGLEVAPGVVIRIVRGAISARPGAEPAASEAQVIEGAADGGAEA